MVDYHVSATVGFDLLKTLTETYGFEAADCYEGCLLDSLIGYTKDGTLTALFEEFETTNSSKFHVMGAKTEEDIKALWDKWNEYTKEGEICGHS